MFLFFFKFQVIKFQVNLLQNDLLYLEITDKFHL